MKLIINSQESLQNALGTLRSEYLSRRYIEVSIKDKERSIDQNSISFAWYEQLARENREYDVNGWRSFCKLHFGVPILRSEDAEFRHFYDNAIRERFTYEDKIKMMSYLPVTSLMKVKQFSAYLEAMQEYFMGKYGIKLEFPEEN